MTRKEAEYKVELMVEDYCKGFAHRMNDEFVEALMVIMNSDFKTFRKDVACEFKNIVRGVNTDVRSFDVDDSTVLLKPITYGRDKLIWLKANAE
jgi:hypothetical protein